MMRRFLALFCLLAVVPAAAADLASAPQLPYKVVPGWAKLPKGWNFSDCSGVAVDKNDNVWVFNRGKHPIVQFDSNGNFLKEFTETGILSAHGIKVDPEGNIWAVDVEGHKIVKFSPEGRVLGVIGRDAGNDDSHYQFNRPTAIAFRPDGGFYVSDGYVNSRIVQYDHNLDYVRHWGRKGSGDGEFNLSHDVAIDRDGRVYGADRTNKRVQVFDANGRFLEKWTDVGTPWGLAYWPKENVLFIADGVDNRVLKADLKGNVLGTLGSYGKTPGKFDFAHHIAIDSTGAIYVAEIKNWRVQKFVPAH